MNLFRTLCVAAVLALGAAGLSSCLSPPDFSDTPEITFKEVRKYFIDRPRGQLDKDSLVFALNFQDGDGDLGLTPNDLLNAPYYQDPNGPRNRNSFNYFISIFRKNRTTGVFEPFNPGDPYDAYFPPPYPLERPAPLKGVLEYALVLEPDGGQLLPNDELRFEISIQDRALHESNKITTSSVVLGPN